MYRLPVLYKLAAALVVVTSAPICLSPGVIAAEANDAIPGLGPTGPVVKLHSGFKFTEGPAADTAGNVFFADIPNSRVHKIDLQGQLSIFREPSGTTNGSMFNAAGELVSCEMEGRVVAVSADGKQVRVLAAQYQGQRFNAPNDLVIDKLGGVYFTDPHFRAPEPLPQGVTAVYYIAIDGTVTRLVDNLKAPNGVILSPDEQTLYVIPSLQAEMMAYPVVSPDELGEGRVFCTLAQPAGKQGTGGDGLTIDEQGNLYITSGLGLQVFSSQGQPLGIIKTAEQPANVTFGGADLRTLYVTARTSVYTIPMSVRGHRFSAGTYTGTTKINGR